MEVGLYEIVSYYQNVKMEFDSSGLGRVWSTDDIHLGSRRVPALTTVDAQLSS